MAAERPVGLTRDAGWQVGVSLTVKADVDAVRAHLASEEGLATWLGEGASPAPEPGATYRADNGTTGEIRSWRPGDRIRATRHAPAEDHETTVQVALGPRPTGTRITLHQERMLDEGERLAMRDHWRAVADRLQAAVEG